MGLILLPVVFNNANNFILNNKSVAFLKKYIPPFFHLITRFSGRILLNSIVNTPYSNHFYTFSTSKYRHVIPHNRVKTTI